LIRIYEDEYFYVHQSSEYKNVPGFYVITEKNTKWNSTSKTINRLAEIEKNIRDGFLELGIQLVGIYREQTPENEFKVLLIPYHLEVLTKLGISPDEYQPYIEKYLKSFNEEHSDSVRNINNVMVKKLNKGVIK